MTCLTARRVFIALAEVIVCSASTIGGEIPFSDAEILESGISGGIHMVPADLNHDGDLDLLVTAYNDDDIFWLRNS